MSVRALTLGLLALAWVVIAGCSPSGPAQEPTVLVKGKLTNAGQPLAIRPGMEQQKSAQPMVSFIREGGGPTSISAPAWIGPDGSFEVRIPKGKYRIAVQQPYAPAGQERLLSQFGQRNSPIFREITTDGQELDIDLSKPQGP
jgi:hypothetical protein